MVVLPGVTIGKDVTIGAGGMVTRICSFPSLDKNRATNAWSQDVPAFHVAVGNPARVIRKIKTSMAE